MCFLWDLHKQNPSLFRDLSFGIYRATVCLSLLITGYQDSGVFAIPSFFFSSPACQTVNLPDVWRLRKWGVENPHKFAWSNWTPPWKIFTLLMVCRLDWEYVINEWDYTQPLLTGLWFNTAQFFLCYPAPLLLFLIPLSLRFLPPLFPRLWPLFTPSVVL